MHVCVWEFHQGHIVWSTSDFHGELLLSLASRVNKQTVCVNLAGCLNIVGSVMFLKVKLYLTQPVF